jgi:hypothetical protein
MAADTSTLVQYLDYASLGGEVVGRRTNRDAVDDEKHHNNSERRYPKKLFFV